MSRTPVVAIAHDYLTQRGGAERVVASMHRAFPAAKIYTTLYDPDSTFPEFRDAEVITSPLNRIAAFRNDHRKALPVLPFAASTMDVPADIVLVSTTGWAHGFRTRGKRLIYCHSPARFLYLPEQYLGTPMWKSAKGWALASMRPFMLAWDRRAARRPGHYFANSTVVRDRIRRVYGIDAAILHPPHRVSQTADLVNVPDLESFVGDGGHHLLVSRLLPYKNVDAAVDAFRDLDERLVIVGAGPLRDTLVASAPSNVRFVTGIHDAQLHWLYSRAKALIAPSFEDFGLTPIEASAWGIPVFALREGGYLDTVIDGVTGRFFDSPTADDIRAVVRRGTNGFDPLTIKSHAARFDEETFIRHIHVIVDALTTNGDE